MDKARVILVMFDVNPGMWANNMTTHPSINIPMHALTK